MSIRLLLVRHGEAVPPFGDKERPLSPRGQVEVNALAQFLARTDIRVNRLYHSGILRAQQTAEILAPVVAIGAVEAIPGMKPDDSPIEFARKIPTWAEDIMLVGHLPFMEILTAYLITRRDRETVAVFETSSMVCLRYVGDERWQLQWMLSPEIVMEQP